MMSPCLIDEQLLTLPELYAEDLPEIMTQPCTLPQGVRRVYALGNGDSYHAAVAAAQAFASWTSLEYIPMPAYTFQTKELPRLSKARAAETLVICISASGSSKLAVSILSAVREGGLGETLSVTGKPGSAMDQAAAWSLSTVIREKGRSPGIRTYAASLCGLLKVACLMGQQDPAVVAQQLQAEAAHMPNFIQASQQAASVCAQWDWPVCSVLGCDGLLGCAKFIAAKFAEGSGVYAGAQELEEWCHVESMTYPLHAPVILLHGCQAESAKVLRVADVAHRAGRKVIIITACGEDAQLCQAADETVCLNLGCPETLNALFHYIPLLPLVRALADKMGRAMFLSDQPFKLY